MTTEVTAIVVNGKLRIDEPFPFPDQTRITLKIESIEKADAAVEAWNELKEFIRLHPIKGMPEKYTRDELHERC